MVASDMFLLWQAEFNGFKLFYSKLNRDLDQVISNFKRKRLEIETTYNENLTSLEKKSKNRNIDLQNLLDRDVRNLEKTYNEDLVRLKSQVPTQNNSAQAVYKKKEVEEKELEDLYNKKITELYDEIEVEHKHSDSNERTNEIGLLYINKKKLIVEWYKEAKALLSETMEEEKRRLNKEFEYKVKKANDNIDGLHVSYKAEKSKINTKIIALSNENTLIASQTKKELLSTLNQELSRLNLEVESNFVKIKSEFDTRKSQLLAIEYLLEKECALENNVQKKLVFNIATVVDSFLFPKEMSRGSLSFEVGAKIFLQLYPNQNENKSNILVLYSEKGKAKALSILSNLLGKFLISFEPSNLQFTAGAQDAADIPKELYHLKIKTSFSHPTPDEFPKQFDSLKKEIDVILTLLHASNKKNVVQFNEESEDAKLRHNLLLLYDVGLKDYASKWETIKYLADNAYKSDFVCLLGLNTNNIPDDTKEKKVKDDLLDYLTEKSIVLDCSLPDLGLSNIKQYQFSETSTFHPVSFKQDLEAVVKQLNLKMEELTKKNYLPITDYLSFDENKWNVNSSLKEIKFKVGNYINTKREAHVILSGSLGDNEFPHLKIEAPAGAGKSTFVNVMITSIALNYSPEQVQFYFIDKYGTAFEKYKNKLPHLKFAALNVGVEEANQLVELLIDEYRSRIKLFTKRRIDEYKELGNNFLMPRIILIIDEFNALWDEGHDNFQRNIKFAATQFRKAGIHIVFLGQNLPKANEFASLQTICLLDRDQTDKIFEKEIRFRSGRFVFGDTLKKTKTEVVDVFAASWDITDGITFSGVDEILNTIPIDKEKYKATILDYGEYILIQEYLINEKIAIGKKANDEVIDFDLFKKQQKNNLVITGGEINQRMDILFSIFYQFSKHPNKKIQVHLLFCDEEIVEFSNNSKFSIIVPKTEEDILNTITHFNGRKLHDAFDEHIVVICDFENQGKEFVRLFGKSEFEESLINISTSNVRYIVESNRMDNIESSFSNQIYTWYRNMIYTNSSYFIVVKSDQQEVNKILGYTIPKIKLNEENRVILHDKSNGSSMILRPFKFQKNENSDS